MIAAAASNTFHERRNRASIRAGKGGPVEVLSMGYGTLETLLSESERTREALKQAAKRHQQENIDRREQEG